MAVINDARLLQCRESDFPVPYSAMQYHTWVVDGIALGEQKSFGNLKFLRVWSAGHMVPMYASKEKQPFFVEITASSYDA